MAEDIAHCKNPKFKSQNQEKLNTMNMRQRENKITHKVVEMIGKIETIIYHQNS